MNFSIRCTVANFNNLKCKKSTYVRQIQQQFMDLNEEFVDFSEYNTFTLRFF